MLIWECSKSNEVLKESSLQRVKLPTKLVVRQSTDPAMLGPAQETEMEPR